MSTNEQIDKIARDLKGVVDKYIKQAYVAGEVNAVNALQSQSPLKCWECSGDDLIFDSNCQWDNREMRWKITWREKEEAYCRACDQQVQVGLKLYGDHENFTMRLI